MPRRNEEAGLLTSPTLSYQRMRSTSASMRPLASRYDFSKTFAIIYARFELPGLQRRRRFVRYE